MNTSHTFLRLFLGTTFALSATACGHLGNSTTGDRGKVEFSYGSLRCLFGCGLEEPMLTGTRETIDLEGADVDEEGLVASSTDASVATFDIQRDCSCEKHEGNSTSVTKSSPDGKCMDSYTFTCTNRVNAHAVKPGDAVVELRKSDGKLLDRATVHVADAATAEVIDGTHDEPVALEVTVPARGEDVLFRATLRDASGKELLSNEGVSWTLQGDSLAPGWCFLCSSNTTAVSPMRPGDTIVTMSAPGIRESFMVHVTEKK